jgi:hypothetical protein
MDSRAVARTTALTNYQTLPYAMDAFGAYGSDSDEEQAEEAPRPMALQVRACECLQGWAASSARGPWALAA